MTSMVPEQAGETQLRWYRLNAGLVTPSYHNAGEKPEVLSLPSPLRAETMPMPGSFNEASSKVQAPHRAQLWLAQRVRREVVLRKTVRNAGLFSQPPPWPHCLRQRSGFAAPHAPSMS